MVLILFAVWFFGYLVPLTQQAQVQQQTDRNAQILQAFHSCLSNNNYPTGFLTETTSSLILVNNNLAAPILEDTCTMETRLLMMLV